MEELSGVKFRLKDFMSTLAAMIVDGDLSKLPAVSVQLRHEGLDTTRRFYARIGQGVAGRQLKNAWKEHPIIAAKNASIESDGDTSDYIW